MYFLLEGEDDAFRRFRLSPPETFASLIPPPQAAVPPLMMPRAAQVPEAIAENFIRGPRVCREAVVELVETPGWACIES